MKVYSISYILFTGGGLSERNALPLGYAIRLKMNPTLQVVTHLKQLELF
jgi:hypothetical protein